MLIPFVEGRWHEGIIYFWNSWGHTYFALYIVMLEQVRVVIKIFVFMSGKVVGAIPGWLAVK